MHAEQTVRQRNVTSAGRRQAMRQWVMRLDEAMVDHAIYVPGGLAVMNVCARRTALEYDVSLWHRAGLVLQRCRRGEAGS